MATACEKLFAERSVRELLDTRDNYALQPVIFAKAGESLSKVVKLMRDNGVHAVPVITEKWQCLGFVDSLDVARYIVATVPDDVREYMQLLASGETTREVFATNCKHVIDFANRHSSAVVHERTPLTNVVELFTRKEFHVAVLKGEELLASVSQYDLLRLVKSEMDKGWGGIASLLPKKVADLNLVFPGQNVHTVRDGESVFKALSNLADNKCTALAVVTDDGVLTGNFSACDLQGVYRHKPPHLETSVRDFLSEFSAKSLNAVCAEKGTSFGDLLQLFLSEHVHHVWVIDDDRKPAGVVTFTDLLNVLLNPDLQ